VIALIADDLTGASDAGVQFARRGLATHVVFDVPERACAADVEALAVDTETRAASPAEAYRRVRDVADRLCAMQPDHVYKKVDSTLRGNLGAEIDAVMDAFDLQLAVVAPSYPVMARTTRYGTHRLHGTPVHETEIGRDPKAPVRESNLVRLLESGSRRRPALVSLETVELGPQAIRDEVDALALERGVSLVVCDAETDRALRAVGESLAYRRDVLWVGSAGLAEHLADLLELPRRRYVAPAIDASDGPVLLVTGSVSEITRQQVAAFLARPGVSEVALDACASSIGGEPARCAELERCCQRLHAALVRGSDCALIVDPRVGQVADADRLVDALGRIAADAARSHRLRGLILTGGDTARAVCRHLGVSGIHLLAEIQPGVPLGRLVGNSAVQLLAVTKAGAFGSERTLLDALDRLKGDT